MRSSSPPRARRSRAPILLWSASTVVVAVLALVLLAHFALSTRRGQAEDQAAMDAVYAGRTTIERLLGILGYISLGSVALALLICVVSAVIRRRFAGAIGVAIVVAGANLTTQLLKRHVLDRPDLGYGILNSLPSGHTTAVASVALAALLVAGPAVRPLVVVLGAFAVTLTGASTIIAGWHRPSDVLAGLAVSLAWGAAVVFVLGLRRSGSFQGAHWLEIAMSLLGAVAAGLLLIVIGVRPERGWPGLADAAVVLGLIGIVSAATVGAFARLSSVHSH